MMSNRKLQFTAQPGCGLAFGIIGDDDHIRKLSYQPIIGWWALVDGDEEDLDAGFAVPICPLDENPSEYVIKMPDGRFYAAEEGYLVSEQEAIDYLDSFSPGTEREAKKSRKNKRIGKAEL